MISILNGIINAMGDVLLIMLGLLPESPFNYVYNINSEWLANINYLFPIVQAVAHLEAFLLAVIVYYGIRIVLRWIKVVGS